MFGAWWAAARALEPGVPLVASEHNALAWPGRPHDAALRAALSRVDHCFAHGPAARTQLLAAGLDRARLSPGRSAIAGARGGARVGLPPGRVVFCGRLALDKGPDVLVEALPRMRPRCPAYFVGDGPLRAHLRERVRALDLSASVTFTGWQREPAGWIGGGAPPAPPPPARARAHTPGPAGGPGAPAVAARGG